MQTSQNCPSFTNCLKVFIPDILIHFDYIHDCRICIGAVALFSLKITYFTPYFERRSLERGEVINFLLMWDGAVKWRLRCFFAEDDTFLFNFILNQGGWSVKQMSVSVWFIMLGHREVSEIMWRVILQWLWYNWTAKPLTLKHILTKKIINRYFFLPLFTNVLPEKAEVRENCRELASK